MTLPELQAQRAELLKGMTQAILEITSPDGTRLVYRSQQEMEGAIRRLDAEIAALATPQESRVFTVQTNRGFAS
ncbi:MAG: hypothetical protein U0Q16_02400 [Bryobacteraceae bacterium]